ncbi:MAG: ribonuclease R [Pseudomonadota bacterium]
MAKATKPRGLPTREAIMGFVRENPQLATKRDIAKAFNLKGDDRVALKHFLNELEADGIFQRRGKRFAEPGALPSVTVLSVTGRDSDGGLIARPVEWDEIENGPAPLISISIPKKPSAKLVIPGVGDRVLTRIGPVGDDGRYTGKVIKRLEKRKQAILGVVRRSRDVYRIEPTERKQDELTVSRDGLGDAKPGDLVEISIVKRGRYGLAHAKVESVIGSLSSEKAVSMIAIHAHGIPHIFPDEVIAEAEAKQPFGPADNGREDWRDVPLITIDPATAKDHDDAVFAEPDADPANVGGHVVTVAIADVAHYVRPGSAMDREALKRGNSVYFPDRVVPMLPERISNDLCSLREDEDRPAMAVRMVFDAQGIKIRHSFHRILMKSHAKLAYEKAQAAIDGAPDGRANELLDSVLTPLWEAYRCMLKGRQNREPLELDLPERKILLNQDGTVDRVVVPPRLDAHKLIEEMMIQANVAAAETLEKARQLLIYRVHDSPALAKQEALREFLSTLDIPLARGAQLRPSVFNTILSKVADTDQAPLVNAVVLRSQSQAEYAPDNYGHFGLNLQRYAHFTSPIRRYADLVVHRALINAIKLGSDGDGLPDLGLDELREVAGLISTSERRAVNAERDTVDRLIAEHLHSRIGDEFDGRVTGISGGGLFVSIEQFGADGFVPAATLGDEYFKHDEALHAMVGEASGHGYRLGDPVLVKISEVQVLAGSMRFEMISEPRKLGTSIKSRHKSRRSTKPIKRSFSRKGAGRTRKQR